MVVPENGDYKINLGEWMPGKRFLQMLFTTKKCELTLNQKLVYSCLHYKRRDKGKEGLTAKEIAERTGLDRSDCVSAALVRLRDLGLCELGGRLHVAKPPDPERHADWFVPRKDGSLAFFQYYLPSARCPLTTNENGLLWLMYSLGEGEYWVEFGAKSGLAKMMGVDRRYLFKWIESLHRHNLIQWLDDDNRYLLLQPGVLDWWADTETAAKAQPSPQTTAETPPPPQPKPEAIPRSEDRGCFVRLSTRRTLRPDPCFSTETVGNYLAGLKGSVDAADQAMRQSGYRPVEIDGYFDHVCDLFRDDLELVWTFMMCVFRDIWRDTESVHSAKGKGRCSVALLNAKTDRHAIPETHTHAGRS